MQTTTPPSHIPWVHTAHLLPLLVDWTPAEDGTHQALVAALPLQGRALVVAFGLKSG